MKYGDLSSIVQLGVGLHVGTAVLQLYSEFGMAPLERRLARIRDLFKLPEGESPSPELREELDRLEGRYGLFKIGFFKQYRWFVAINSIIATVLAVFLIIIACKADDILDRYEWFAVVAISLSFIPAPLMLGVLWWDSRRRVAPLTKIADDIETRAITEG
ncbi:MAG: hypothetical protein QOI05_2145 [Bradyrhizobium sp.]|jgi:hypothetical protein|nr:hypothetical protein [Bradyrhizobium sp.]